MHTRPVCHFLTFIFLFCIAGALCAGGAQIQADRMQQDFEKGATDEMLVKGGTLSLALEKKILLKEPVDFVWDIAPFGDSLYAATGNDGRILKITGESEMKKAPLNVEYNIR